MPPPRKKLIKRAGKKNIYQLGESTTKREFVHIHPRTDRLTRGKDKRPLTQK